MGAKEDGPFSYVMGSLQLYAEALTYHANESTITSLKTGKTKADFKDHVSLMKNLNLKKQAQNFLKRTGSGYCNFVHEEHENGLHVFKATNPGRVKGSYAEYIKFCYKDGTIRAVFKDTVDNKGKPVHRHIKYPVKRNNMEKHKFEEVLKFVHLDGIKEFKETNPSLFSEDGISTSTLEIDNGQNVPVTIEDAKRACELFLKDELTLFQLQQWGEWIHMIDFFEMIPNPDEDETLLNALSDIDSLDMVEPENAKRIVAEILSSINNQQK